MEGTTSSGGFPQHKFILGHFLPSMVAARARYDRLPLTGPGALDSWANEYPGEDWPLWRDRAVIQLSVWPGSSDLWRVSGVI